MRFGNLQAHIVVFDTGEFRHAHGKTPPLDIEGRRWRVWGAR